MDDAASLPKCGKVPGSTEGARSAVGEPPAVAGKVEEPPAASAGKVEELPAASGAVSAPTVDRGVKGGLSRLAVRQSSKASLPSCSECILCAK